MLRKILLSLMLTSFALPLTSLVGQDEVPIPPAAKETQPKAPAKVDIKPTARDHEIRQRLEGILKATGWYNQVNVQVKEGVVFLNGVAKTDEFKKWAGELARNTQDVSAVVNKIEIAQPSIWDFQPSILALREFWRDLLGALPTLALGLIILLASWFLAKGVIALSHKVLKTHIQSPLLQDVVSKAVGVLIILLGLYVVFKILGLTTVAFTIIGGTGLLGIILGIAFRDITENLLASIFLSIHHPFRSGDLVEIDGIQGYVQRLTMRSTVLITLTGNHVQIPNATVYKNIIHNFTVNPNRQESFLISIGNEEAIPETQEVALKVLSDHPAVLKDPEPWVLVDNLNGGAVNLKIYFWLDGTEHSWLKVRSSVIRLIKRAFQDQSITLPGEVRELYFSKELSVKIMDQDTHESFMPRPSEKPPVEEADPVATLAEGGLTSDSKEIEEQAKQSRTPERGEKDLLNPKKPEQEE